MVIKLFTPWYSLQMIFKKSSGQAPELIGQYSPFIYLMLNANDVFGACYICVILNFSSVSDDRVFSAFKWANVYQQRRPAHGIGPCFKVAAMTNQSRHEKALV